MTEVSLFVILFIPDDKMSVARGMGSSACVDSSLLRPVRSPSCLTLHRNLTAVPRERGHFLRRSIIRLEALACRGDMTHLRSHSQEVGW